MRELKNQAKSSPVVLDERKDGERRVVVNEIGDDKFVRSGKQVIEACRLDISIELWLQEFHALGDCIQQWCEAQHDKVDTCYVVARSGRVVLFFVPKASQFDFELADLLAPLNRELVKDFRVGMIEIQQIPAGDIDRFVDRNDARALYVDGGGTPGPVAT